MYRTDARHQKYHCICKRDTWVELTTVRNEICLNFNFRGGGGEGVYSRVNFGHLKSEVFSLGEGGSLV